METLIIEPQPQQMMPQGRPQNRSFWVRNAMPLDFVYYAVATEHLGEVDNYFEYEMEEGADGNFQVTVPCPPGRLDRWTVLVYGYRDGQRVMQEEFNALQIFF